MSLDPLVSGCPVCWAKPGQPCRPCPGTHRERLKAAEALAHARRVLAEKAERSPGCQCANHMGTPKQRHKTKAAALRWAVSRTAVRGMRLEPYRCPTTPGVWHVRTAKAARVTSGAGP
jgi:hypothetical protein